MYLACAVQVDALNLERASMTRGAATLGAGELLPGAGGFN